MTKTKVTVFVLVIALLCAISPAQAWIWGRWRVTGWQALVGADGQFLDRYQMISVADSGAPGTCLVIVRDMQTEAFTTTSVPAESCQ